MASALKRLDEAIASAISERNELQRIAKSTKRTYDRIEHTSALKVMTGPWKRTLMMVYLLSNDFDTARDYCNYMRANWHGDNNTGWIDKAEMVELISNNLRTNVPWKDYITIEHANRAEHWKAAFWLAEFKTYMDLIQLNTKGVTPPGHVIADLLESNFAESSKGARALTWFRRLHTEPGVRHSWLLTFRKKWGVGFRVLPQRAPLSDGDIQKKDPICNMKC